MEVVEICRELEKLKERFENLGKDYEELCKAAKKFLNLLSIRHEAKNLPTRTFPLTDSLNLRLGEYIYFSFPLNRSFTEEVLKPKRLDPCVSEIYTVAKALYILDHAPEILRGLRAVEEEVAEEDRRVREILETLREIVGVLAVMRRVGE